ncbi:MAG: 50S ribosomal protein L17 [Tannerella sp.]|jgi:large subunit ribosomal protein L17|nr:50S ribosomal protein L17 [Tannerella sp.]
MRHNKKINHLGRTSSHRQAMLSNMASSLIKHKRIFTTTAKAKALRKYVEPLVTKSKEDTTHSRRIVFSFLQDKIAVTELFAVVSQKVGDRPGGYTRIIKTGNRLGDNAAMCFIELVDFNENMLKETKKAASKTRRSRSKKSAEAKAQTAEQTKVAEEVKTVEETKTEEVVKADVIKAEEIVEETPTEESVEEVKTDEVAETPTEESAEEPKAE